MRRDSSRYERITESVTKSFENHVASYWKLQSGDSPTVEVLRFQEPGTSNYFIEFLMTNGTLMVRGDLGEATYCWYSDVDMAFLERINMGYMAGKCQACEAGRKFLEWDGDAVRESLLYHFEQCDDYDTLSSYMTDEERENYDDLESAQLDIISKRYAEEKTSEICSSATIENEHEWVCWLHDNADMLNDDDHWEWSYSAGEVPHVRLFCHFIGMKLAIKQIKEKESMADLRSMNRG